MPNLPKFSLFVKQSQVLDVSVKSYNLKPSVLKRLKRALQGNSSSELTISTVSTSSQCQEDLDSLNAVFNVLKENEEKGTKTNIIPSVIEGFREKISLVMFPLPKSLGLSTTVLVRKTKLGYSFILLGRKEIVLLTAKKYSSGLEKGYNIFLSGKLKCSVGRLVFGSTGSSIFARSFYKKLDQTTDRKYNLYPNPKSLSKAKLKHIGSISRKVNENIANGVVLEGVTEVKEWDALQSVTGYYGIKHTSPYRRQNEHSTERGHVHSTLFNEEGRSLDHLGKKFNAFPCVVEKDDKTISMKHGATRFCYFNIEKLENKNEFKVNFSWPLSPLQAFQLFLGIL